MQHFLLELIPIQCILNSIVRTVSVCKRLIVILIMHEAALARICQYADLILCNVLCRADFSVCNRNNGSCLYEDRYFIKCSRSEFFNNTAYLLFDLRRPV